MILAPSTDAPAPKPVTLFLRPSFTITASNGAMDVKVTAVPPPKTPKARA